MDGRSNIDLGLDSKRAAQSANDVVADGQTYECWVGRNSAGAGHNLTYVAEKPPYLIRQVAVAEDGTKQTVVLLKQVGS